MLCKQLHHAAFRCRDAQETVDFYTDVLGLKFVHAMGADHVPSTGEYSPHMHVFLELEDGSNIAFFEVPNADGGMRDETMPDWIQHFAFRVEDEAALLAAKGKLEARGIDVIGPTNHDDFILSIYFHDPSGHRLELTTPICEPERLRLYEQEAQRVLSVWNETHDWSQREKAFGSAEGYAWEKVRKR